MTGENIIIALRAFAVTKAFGATVALSEAGLEVRNGEVHALLGENGAGKSTLVKILSGLMLPDSGELQVKGEKGRFSSRRAAHRAGVQTVFQEVSLIPDLTVVQNVLLPFAPTGFLWQLKQKAGRAFVEAEFERLGLGDIDPNAEIRDLSLNLRQKIEIARAVIRKPKILLLDEPTASLSGNDVDWFGSLIARLKGEGVTIVFVSHRIPEARAFCDRITILRNGSNVGTFSVPEVTNDQVIDLIIGRSLRATFPERTPAPASTTPLFEARSLSVGDELSDVGIALGAGEILGVAGLQGMGQRELFLGLFGALPATQGEIFVKGERVSIEKPADAINLGVCLVPEERKTEGIFLNLDGRTNISIAALAKFSRKGFIDRSAESRAVSAALARVQVDQRALHTRVSAFSGGNQQKIAIAKWLSNKSRVLLMFDPTRGVDVGTKSEIYHLMKDYTAAGGAILFYSTELTELTNMAHQILVLYGGRITAEIMPTDSGFEENDIMRAMLGGDSSDPVALIEEAGRVGA